MDRKRAKAELEQNEKDEYISRKDVVDIVHSTMRKFFTPCGFELSAEDRVLLSLNKSICSQIRELPAACDVDNIKRTIEEAIKSEERFHGTENARAQISALLWVLEVIDEYTKGGSK